MGCGGMEDSGIGEWIEVCELCVIFGEGQLGWWGEMFCFNGNWSQECVYYVMIECVV